MTITDAAEAAIPRGRCAVAGCTAATDGTCVRGNDSPLDCDQFELELEPEPLSETVPATEPRLPLPHGRALRPDELAAVLRHHAASRVVPLGMISAGKTTLFAVLFEFVTARRLDGWRYVRSATTLGFAQRSHDAALRSNRVKPTTGRTSGAAGNELLHLCVRSAADDALRNLLLADVSGEHVEALTMEGRYEPFLRDAVADADHLLILVDGERAADPSTRQNAIRHAVDIAQVLPDLPPPYDALLSVVLTKVDYFETDADVQAVLGDVARAVIECTAREPRMFAVAARPKPGGRVDPGHGLHSLFEHVVEPPRRSRDDVFHASAAVPSPEILRRIWRAQ